ncbi:Uncharacterised protein [BD1-7 clade bacterium]|uniref:Uncharacterized protein n=1 Tax=BD1-7 clade bacterium TaxID=2029982 RepID=A0A5S9QV45_9GAMM|nr:Uncharacterised protein [BD1-7 clade bacterium]
MNSIELKSPVLRLLALEWSNGGFEYHTLLVEDGYFPGKCGSIILYSQEYIDSVERYKEAGHQIFTLHIANDWIGNGISPIRSLDGNGFAFSSNTYLFDQHCESHCLGIRELDGAIYMRSVVCHGPPSQIPKSYFDISGIDDEGEEVIEFSMDKKTFFELYQDGMAIWKGVCRLDDA